MIKVGDKYITFTSHGYNLDTITDITESMVFYSCYVAQFATTISSKFSLTSYKSIIDKKILIKIENEEYIKFLYAKH